MDGTPPSAAACLGDTLFSVWQLTTTSVWFKISLVVILLVKGGDLDASSRFERWHRREQGRWWDRLEGRQRHRPRWFRWRESRQFAGRLARIPRGQSPREFY